MRIARASLAWPHAAVSLKAQVDGGLKALNTAIKSCLGFSDGLKISWRPGMIESVLARQKRCR